MKLCRTIDRPEQKYTLAMMGYGEEKETTVLELTYNSGVTEYTKRKAYTQVAISSTDVYKSAEVVNLVIQELGGKVTKQAGPLPRIGTKILSFLDPDGWKTVLVDHEDFLKELHKESCSYALRGRERQADESLPNDELASYVPVKRRRLCHERTV